MKLLQSPAIGELVLPTSHSCRALPPPEACDEERASTQFNGSFSVCTTGYRGFACQLCEPGYVGTACQACTGSVITVLWTLGIALVLVGVIVVVVYGLIRDQGALSTRPSIQKILLNHLQMAPLLLKLRSSEKWRVMCLHS